MICRTSTSTRPTPADQLDQELQQLLAGQLLILREVEKRTGKPAAFIETDLVDRATSRREREEPGWELLPDGQGESATRPPPPVAH